MLNFAIFLIIIVLGLRFFVLSIKSHKTYTEYGVSPVLATFLHLSPLLYLLSATAFVVPVSWLVWLVPVPFGVALLLPGMTAGKMTHSVLERSGVDTGVMAGNVAANIMWLGVGVGVWFAINIAINLTISSYN